MSNLTSKPISDHWFSQQVIQWQRQHGRHHLPWQDNPTPYRVWVSEIMLQQTQVTTVIEYYQRFMQTFPQISDLAQGSEDAVLALWSGLGYYSRARNLHKTAGIIHTELKGVFPKTLAEVVALPGIGRSTAAAILSLSQGQREAILDGNVKRVLCRFHALEGWPSQSRVEKRLWLYAEQHLPDTGIQSYTQGLMDMGATLCTRRKPNCSQCPLNTHCQAYQRDLTEQLPSPRPKKARPKKHTAVLVVFNAAQQVLLVKRPPSGIWGGLWSLPEVDANQTCFDGMPYQTVACSLPIKHQFSHFQLTLMPLYATVGTATASPTKIMETAEQGWYNAQEITALGLAAPIKKLLLNGYQANELDL